MVTPEETRCHVTLALIVISRPNRSRAQIRVSSAILIFRIWRESHSDPVFTLISPSVSRVLASH